MSLVSSITSTTANIQRAMAGRVRYLRAMRSLMTIEASYRRARKLSKRDGADIHMQEAHEKAATVLAKLCKDNGGTWVKMAQFFSCRSDILPGPYIEQLQTLQNEATPVPFHEVAHILHETWGEGWEQQFSEFGLIPIACASIAQVHKAVLKDGTKVAIKVQLPHVEETFKQDIASFRLVAGMIAPLVKEIDVKQVGEQLVATTLQELDFELEAKNLDRFTQIQHIDGIKIPKHFPELSSKNILVTEWVDGKRLREFLDDNNEKAEKLLATLLRSYVQQVTCYGVYHADPHPGNFIIDDNDDIWILDYGALGLLKPEEVTSYAKLLTALMMGNTADYETLFEEAGFVGGDASTLAELADYVLSDRMKDQEFSETMQELLGLFRDRKVSIPDSYIGMARVLITIGGFLTQYDVPLDWQTALLPAPAA